MESTVHHETRSVILRKLFISTFYLSAFTFGGGYVIPPFTILSLISFCYTAFRSNQYVGWMLNGMQSGVGAVIMEVVWEMSSGIVKEKQAGPLIIMAAAFIANYIFGVSAVIIILFCIALGVAVTLRREKQQKGGSL